MIGSIAPTEARVLIKHLNEEEQTASGLVLPSTTRTTLTKAIIVAAGPGRITNNGVRAPMSATQDKVGTKILVKTNAGVDFGSGERLIDDSEILGFVS